MADENVATSHLADVARINARATIAAALLASKVVDLSNAHSISPATASLSPAMQKLKNAVDAIMIAVVQAK